MEWVRLEPWLPGSSGERTRPTPPLEEEDEMNYCIYCGLPLVKGMILVSVCRCLLSVDILPRQRGHVMIISSPKGYRVWTFEYYEDLEIAIGNGVAVRKNSIGLGSVTHARTLGASEGIDVSIEDLEFDVDSDAFIRPKDNDKSFHSISITFSIFGIFGGSHARNNPKKKKK
ncbi:hypothetical protein LguiA_005081 [Lonicera macranthoides]